MRGSWKIRTALLVGAAMVILWSLFPFLWFFLTSLTTPGNIPRTFALPETFTLEAYRTVLFGSSAAVSGSKFSIVPNIVNSFIVAMITVALCVALSFGAAYVFSRYRSRGLDVAFNWLLLIRMTPALSLAVPIYLMITNYGLADTHIGLSLVYTMLSLPLAIWLMKGFIDTIPIEIEEAARIDGASFFQVFRLIVLPLAAPGIAVTACFIFLASYIEYMFSLILTRGSVATLPLAIAGYNNEHQTFYNEMAAASFVSMIPLALFFALAGRYMVRGLTMGAVK